MRKHFLAVAILAASSALPAAMLLSTAGASAQAAPLCESVTVLGVTGTHTVGDCIPYSGAVICDTGTQGLSPTLVVKDTACVPAIVTATAPSSY
jgi:hypothetical protein